jgi:regulatory protein
MTKSKPSNSNSNPEKPRPQKAPKRITDTYLHNSGLYYLERYSASSSHFRTVMLRKVKRSCMHHTDQNYEDCSKLVDDLIVKFERSGLLNDDLYIASMVASFRRKGLSKRMIIQKLLMKGIAAETVNTYLSEYNEQKNKSTESTELKAAAIFCRKKKLGAYKGINTPEPDKQLARLARAGFGFGAAKKILEMSEDDLHTLIYSDLHLD